MSYTGQWIGSKSFWWGISRGFVCIWFRMSQIVSNNFKIWRDVTCFFYCIYYISLSYFWRKSDFSHFRVDHIKRSVIFPIFNQFSYRFNVRFPFFDMSCDCPWLGLWITLRKNRNDSGVRLLVLIWKSHGNLIFP